MKDSLTSIVATIGPSSAEPGVMSALITAGLDVARLNFAWGDAEEHRHFIRLIRAEAEKLGVRVPILCDLAGPRVQSGSDHHVGEGPIITEEDKVDVLLGIEENVEYFAQSYVRNGHDIEELRALLGNHPIKIIAKIERSVALANIAAILTAADGIMVARGDLGNEVPLEQIPFIEEELIAEARSAGKPVIVATEMMTSMITNARPSRADVTDVAFAVTRGADAVMLSNETAVGKYPVETVTYMERIVAEAEKRSSFERKPF